MTTLPATIDLNPTQSPPSGSVIWLHGLGADGNDFVPIADQFNIMEEYNLRFVFPHAPIRPITINGGALMRGWYDIAEMDLARKEDIEGVKSSKLLIDHLIDREIALGVPSTSIVLAGFSQGGAMALYTGLRSTKSLAAIMALSTYLPFANTLNIERNPNNNKLPIYMAHGLFDPIVPLMLGDMTRQQLQSLGYPVEWHTYPMPHTVTQEEISDMAQFLKKIFSNINSI